MCFLKDICVFAQIYVFSHRYMCFLIDHTPARNSRGSLQQWLGIDKGAIWTHSGQPLNFTNWKGPSDGNKDLGTSVGYGSWKWDNTWRFSEKAVFICEKNI